MAPAMARGIIDEMAVVGVSYWYLHLWGEPTLEADLLAKCIDRIHDLGGLCNVSTNGQRPDTADIVARADDVSVSMEGMDQATYAITRGNGKHALAWETMRRLAKAKPGKVAWTWLAHRSNLAQIPDAKRYAEQIGVILGVKPPHYLDARQREQWEASGQAPTRYASDGSLLADRTKCREFSETIYFLCDGRVVTCCFDVAGRWSPGAWRETGDGLAAWTSAMYRMMRAKQDRGELCEMCATQCARA
jgi:MoaA/NifB/PqqE/SkfB family radical SAM enzyme